MASFDFEFCITPATVVDGVRYFGPDIEGVATVEYDPADAALGGWWIEQEWVRMYASPDPRVTPVGDMPPAPTAVRPDPVVAAYLVHTLLTDPTQRARIEAKLADAESDADRRAEAVAHTFAKET